MQEQDNNGIGDLSRRGVLMGAATGGLLIAVSGAMLAPSANAATAKLKKGGVLRIGVNGGPAETQDAHLGGFTADTARQYQLYDRLVVRDSNFKLVNELAESFTANKTGNVWTVKLKKGVKFHNGKELVAEDLIYTIQRILDPATKALKASLLANVDLPNLKKVGTYTVEIALKSADVVFNEPWSNYAMGIVPVGYDPKNPVGTGPFKYVSFTPGVKSVYNKHTEYWRTGQPYVDSVEILTLENETARVNALLSGQVDAITDLPTAQVSAVKGNKKFKVLNAKTGGMVPIVMNTVKTPFTDPLVRQAFRLMIDRNTVVKQAYAGNAILGNDVLATFDPGSNKNLKQRAYDPEKAKALLKKAKVKVSSIELKTTNDVEGMASIPQIFKSGAKKAGVDVSITNSASMWDGWPGGQAFHMDYYLARGYLDHARVVYMGGSYAKETGWSNPAYEKLIKQAVKTTSTSVRNEIIADAQQIEYDDGAYIITSFYNKIDGYSAKIDGFGTGNPEGNSLNNFTLRAVGFIA